MRLHHATGDDGIRRIIGSRSITPTWHCRMDDGSEMTLIWLCDRPDGWVRSIATDGAEATTHRITVEVPDNQVTSWDQLKQSPGFPWRIPKVLEDSAIRDELGIPSAWFVMARPIPDSEWIEISRISDGRVIWTPLEG
jgi:hypothetical protein